MKEFLDNVALLVSWMSFRQSERRWVGVLPPKDPMRAVGY